MRFSNAVKALAMAMFRIFQELLSNIVRHAQASRILVRITTDHAALSILVRDNGLGAVPEAFDAPNAHGVMGMRERARQNGGHLAIHSQLGEGSAFHLRIPLGRLGLAYPPADGG